MAHQQIETQYIGQQALTASRATRFRTDFPLGERWLSMNLRIAATLTVGASPVGAVALEDPLLEIITGIRLEVDRDGVLFNAPAKALFYWATARQGTPPNMDEASFAANTAAAYAMSVNIPLAFEDKRMNRQQDTSLRTDRYSKMDLIVTMGDGSECLSTVHSSGGGIVLSAMTVDVEVEKDPGAVRVDQAPNLVQRVEMEAQAIDTSADTQVNLTRQGARAIKRLYCWAGNLGVTGRPWSGNGHNGILSTLAVRSNQRAHQDARLASQVRDGAKLAYALDTLPTGLYILDFVKDKSHWSALPTGDKSFLRVEQAEASGNPAGMNTLSVLAEALHEFGA